MNKIIFKKILEKVGFSLKYYQETIVKDNEAEYKNIVISMMCPCGRPLIEYMNTNEKYFAENKSKFMNDFCVELKRHLAED